MDTTCAGAPAVELPAGTVVAGDVLLTANGQTVHVRRVLFEDENGGPQLIAAMQAGDRVRMVLGAVTLDRAAPEEFGFEGGRA